MEATRIDKWLWAARFFKTRSLATDAVAGGRAHVNGARVKPARDVKAGDTVVVRVGEVEWTVTVTAIADRRGSATDAAKLYAETPESATRRELHATQRKLARPLGAELAGRPTKLDRRRLDALRKSQGQGSRGDGRGDGRR